MLKLKIDNIIKYFFNIKMIGSSHDRMRTISNL
jgi:hypothetical protein